MLDKVRNHMISYIHHMQTPLVLFFSSLFSIGYIFLYSHWYICRFSFGLKVMDAICSYLPNTEIPILRAGFMFLSSRTFCFSIRVGFGVTFGLQFEPSHLVPDLSQIKSILVNTFFSEAGYILIFFPFFHDSLILCFYFLFLFFYFQLEGVEPL